MVNHTIYINQINEKIRKHDLKSNLYELFGEYGKILEIVALRSIKLRGQAFVTFDDPTSASKAIQECQGFELFGQPINIQYAKNESDIITKREGTYVDKKTQRKRKRSEQVDEAKQHSKRTATDTTEKKEIYVGRDGVNRILFLENVPGNVTKEQLVPIFQGQSGFVEVRLIDSKPGIAFVEFTDEGSSTKCMNTLQGFALAPEHHVKISYAKQ